MEPAGELVPFLERVWRAFETKDADAVASAISDDKSALMIGSAPDEWWQGRAAIAAAARVQFQELPALRFEPEEIVAWREGTVGWVAARADVVMDGIPGLPTRTTVVVREEGAYWRIVHWHLSVPVDNEQSLGVTLTVAVDELLRLVQNEQPTIPVVGRDGAVTIVFTDIEGSTALLEVLGEPRWLDLLDWHTGVVEQQVALFGGSVVKGQGDGFMLAFTAPGPAVACARAVQQRVGAGWSGVPVRVRIGMHTGNAKAEGGDFFGRTVVVAARVAGAAAGGETLLSYAVQAQLDGAFPVGSPRAVTLKGLPGEYEVFPLITEA